MTSVLAHVESNLKNRPHRKIHIHIHRNRKISKDSTSPYARIKNQETLKNVENKNSLISPDLSVSQGLDSSELLIRDVKPEPAVENDSNEERRHTVEYSPIHKVHIKDKGKIIHNTSKEGNYRLSVQNDMSVRLSIDVVNLQAKKAEIENNLPLRQKYYAPPINTNKGKKIPTNLSSPKLSIINKDHRLGALNQLFVQEKSDTKSHTMGSRKSSINRAVFDSRQIGKNKVFGERITDFGSQINKKKESLPLANRESRSFDQPTKSEREVKERTVSTEEAKLVLPSNKLNKDWETVGISLTRATIFQVAGEPRTSVLATQPLGKEKIPKPEQHFITGSKYAGYWNELGFAGVGSYTFVHGAVYNGTFKNGDFHGYGTITYPSGVKVKGQWKNGKLLSQKILLDNGLEIAEPWTYCEMPDRRFQVEHTLGLNGADEEYISNKQPPKDIPKDCYDATDGYFDPNVKTIFKYAKPPRYSDQSDSEFFKAERREIVRIPLKKEVDRILHHHRRSEALPVGYRPDLYEEWMTGEREFEDYVEDRHSFYSMQSEDSGSSAENVQVEIEVLRTK